MSRPLANPSPECAADAARFRRIVTPWRRLFWAYALALTIGTHWPRLALRPEIPTSDKIIHFLAFGGLALLLWRTRWFTSRWLVVLIALIWSLIDEASQAIPLLHRSAHWHDMLANALGVVVAGTWLWALQPLGGPHGANRIRLRASSDAFDEMFAQRRAWLAAVAGLLAGAIPLLALWPLLSVEAARIAISAAIILCILVMAFLWQGQWQAQIARAMGDQPQRPSSRVIARLSVRPALIALVTLLCGFALIFATPLIYNLLLQRSAASSESIMAMRAARAIGTLPQPLTNSIDFSLYLLLLAVVVRVYRGGLARFYERAVRCLSCGHDLRGTPAGSDGIGRCGECGAAFIRYRQAHQE